MNEFHFPVRAGARIIDATAGSVLEGAALEDLISSMARQLVPLPVGVVFVQMAVDPASVVRYLGGLRAQRAVALLDPGLDVRFVYKLVGKFKPAAVLLTESKDEPPPGYGRGDLAGPAWVRVHDDGAVPHPDLMLLLPTSGSTGNPKLVRLSSNAVVTNAFAIAEALEISPEDIAPTSLPLHYSYGLSVLNSHLVAGATVLLEPRSLVTRNFWDSVGEHSASSFAGVPHHYEILRRLHFEPRKFPSLRTLTQAGGKMATDRVQSFALAMQEVGGRLFVMYGQTEAAPRMSTLPSKRVFDKPGSVGLPLSGGSFRIRAIGTDRAVGFLETGEVIYEGPNVMMGYAETADDLRRGDDLGGVLVTGDLGYLDDEGFLFITGRLKRIGKVFGNRVNLDDVEQRAESLHAGSAVVSGDDKLVVWLESASSDTCREVARELAKQLRQHVSGFHVRSIDSIPRLGNGKPDYRALEAGLD